MRRKLLKRNILEPADRIAEVMFGLIMALTFTGSLSISDAGRNDVRAMLIGALGCNLAWGLIDGIFYVMVTFADRGGDTRAIHSVRTAPDPVRGRALLAEALPDEVSAVLTDEQLEGVRTRLVQAAVPARERLGGRDFLAALAVCTLVFCSTLPIALPFLLIDGVQPAMRASNAVAIAMLFVAGALYGRAVGGRRPWAVGVAMVLLGCVLVAMTIALGG